MAAQVLVIDDSLLTRKLLDVSLSRAGFQVATYPNGPEALRALRVQEPPLPALVILDIGLPLLDGYTIARQLSSRPEYGRPTILMLSGRTSIADRLKARLAGARAYLTKPFKEQELLAVVRLRGSALLVTLNACQSATPEETQFANLARTLVQEQVPYALGMRFLIFDRDARLFSRAFYRE